MFKIVQDFLTDVSDVDDDDTLCDVFSRAIGSMGYDMFCAWTDGATDKAAEDGLLLQQYPDDWLVYYHDREYWKIDPLYRLSRMATEPFLWTDPRITGRFAKQEQAMMDEAVEAGVGGGLIVPVRTSFSPLGNVSILDSARDVDPSETVKLYNLAVYFYDTARRAAERRSGETERDLSPLSVHERECLLWLSAGKSDWEIGAMLTISELEVKHHVARAMYKIGVPTRTQAVVQAVMTDQIIP